MSRKDQKVCSSRGGPLQDGYDEIDPATGLQKDYVALCPEERAKGFVAPVRESYRHLKCNGVTTMSRPLAETYARDPTFYDGTYCATCRTHFALAEFVWLDGQSLDVNLRQESRQPTPEGPR